MTYQEALKIASEQFPNIPASELETLAEEIMEEENNGKVIPM